MTAEDFDEIARRCYADSGISLTRPKATLVYARLAKRLRALGLDSFRAYLEVIEADTGGERREMRAALTTNVTRFFREPHHFDHVRDVAVPVWRAASRRGSKIRLWSAACSSGQEPFSLAITLLTAWPEVADADVRILATDIDPYIIARARDGVYSEAELEGMNARQREAHFVPEPVGGERRWKASPRLASMIAFRELNLIGDWPMKGRFQAIMCRNVAIYFDEPTQQTLWARFAKAMEPGAWLYIGHSERVAGSAASALGNAGVSTYRKHEGRLA
jgi:chemotaxis protein methyltransferase CheR